MPWLCALCDKKLNVNNADRVVHPVYFKLVLVCRDKILCKNKYEVTAPVVVHKPKDKARGSAKYRNSQKFRVGGN